jgi:catechol 2,3-dioxygenase-like lactoylglutathione lyase family enzyme
MYHLEEEDRMSRIQLALNVDDVEAATAFYAKQDKFWVEGSPDGERWEIYTVLADSQTFFGEPDAGSACCGGETAETTSEPAAAGAARCC